jgi:hypothetical protein
MQSISGVLAQTIHTQSGQELKLTFNVLSYCLTSECATNGLSIYSTEAVIPMIPEKSTLIYKYTSDKMNVWITKSITFIAPSDNFNVTFNAFSNGPRSSGILLDNIILINGKYI